MNACRKDGNWVVTLCGCDKTRVFEATSRFYLRALDAAKKARDAAEGVTTLDAWKGKAA